MALSFTNLTVNGSTSNTNSFNTASISPTANRLVLVTVTNAFTSNTPTVTGASMTWELAGTYLRSTNDFRISVFRAMSSSPGSGALTISFSSNQTRTTWSVNQSGADIALGANGANAIVQSVGGETAASNSGLTLNLAAFSNVANGAFGAVREGGNAGITPGSGFTELSENTSTPDAVQTQYKATNDTSVDWSWSGVGDRSIGIAFEITTITPPSGGGIMFFDGLALA